jgi:hypothetical protein
MLLRTIDQLYNLRTEPTFKVVQNNDQRLENISNTTISLQYNRDTFLSFKVYEASEGFIMRQGDEIIGFDCLIRGTTYRFTREHLEQLSTRELHELCNQLGIQAMYFPFT